MKRYEYHRPRSLEEALRLKGADPGACYVAGATDVMVRVRAGDLAPTALISLRGVPELRGIDFGDVGRGARLGAATTIGEIAAHPGLREAYPVLAQAAAVLGSVQIRNAATVGGNLCNASPCADTAPALLVLGARLRLQRPGGHREVPLEEFFRGPGETCLARDEVVTQVLLDPPAAGARSAYRKQGRVHMDLAQASLAVLVELDGATCRRALLAAGSVAPVPLRLKPVEALLAGTRLDEGVLAEAGALAARTVAPITDVRATADYRRAIVGVFLRRMLADLRDGGARPARRPA
ncbi:MAG: xanthine dehydrogenase family protein subunit M [Deltaproteobacteria bacterium]|nr:xanthine dehydrogenase family protein subunit M [Deltaproteobacteria bacterium]